MARTRGVLHLDMPLLWIGKMLGRAHAPRRHPYMHRRFLKPDYFPPPPRLSSFTKQGGLAVLAHPLTHSVDYTLESIEPLIGQLKELDLDGLEAIYSSYEQKTREGLLALADKHGLLISAGSDFRSSTPPSMSPF
ncbi:MAG: hypothetical protein IT292_02750 [Deltaproteobacteria bacterium]|nr:hypothetical protein [Deltaproteobacteria bacterium]